MELKTRIYQKENKRHLGRLIKVSLIDVYSSRFLAKQLAVRDIKAMYRQSYLGIVWAFITPLTTAFVWVFLNSSGTIQLTDTGIPYPVYAFSGTLLWSIIRDSIHSPAVSTNAARGILSKINFPKEALVVSGIYKLLFNSLVKVALLFLFLIVYKVGFHSSLMLFPFAILGVILFGTAIGLFLTPIGLLYKDVSKVISLGLGLMMYLTPVVYVIPTKGILKSLMELNPLTPLILTSRDIIVGTPPTMLIYFIVIILISLPLLLLGLVFYRISIPIIVERMNA